MLDYIIVGGGLAGIAFADVLERHNKSYRLFHNDVQQSSKIAAGIYNPVMLKRLSPIETANEQLDAMHRFYESVEKKLGTKFLFPSEIYRRLSSIEELNNWYARSDNPELSRFMSEGIVPNRLADIDAPNGFGIVNSTGHVDTAKLLEKHNSYLHSTNKGIFETFDFSLFSSDDNCVSYKDLWATNIVFCEGFGLSNNPYFNYLPLDGTKGELLIIESSQLKSDVIVSGGVFIISLGENLFKVGSTYNWRDKSSEITAEGKSELLEKLEVLINCEYKVVSHLAAIRPTVKDRSPLVGTHPVNNRLHILNGLGSRGVMLAPLYSELLYDSIENGSSLSKSISIERFSKYFLGSCRS